LSSEVKLIESILLGGSVAAVVACFFLLRGKRKEIALALVSLVFTGLLAEMYLRAFDPQINEANSMFEYDDSLGWRFIAGKSGTIVYPGESDHDIKINARGFRDAPPEGEHGKKILVLGDSFVSNISVEDNEVFTEVMERQLPGTSVLNFGVNGYGQVQEYLLMERWLRRLQPELVVVVIYVRNDFHDNIGGFWIYPRPVATLRGDSLTISAVPPPRAKPSFAHSVLHAYSHLQVYHLIDSGIEALVTRLHPPDENGPSRNTPAELYLCQAQPSPQTENMFAVTEALLLQMARLAKERSVPILFIVAPSIVQVRRSLWDSVLGRYGKRREDYRLTAPNDRLIRFARSHNLQMVDLLPALRHAADEGRPVYSRREQHWNAEGNQVVAEVLLDYLRTNSLFSTSGGAKREE